MTHLMDEIAGEAMKLVGSRTQPFMLGRCRLLVLCVVGG